MGARLCLVVPPRRGARPRGWVRPARPNTEPPRGAPKLCVPEDARGPAAAAPRTQQGAPPKSATFPRDWGEPDEGRGKIVLQYRGQARAISPPNSPFWGESACSATVARVPALGLVAQSPFE